MYLSFSINLSYDEGVHIVFGAGGHMIAISNKNIMTEPANGNVNDRDSNKISGEIKVADRYRMYYKCLVCIVDIMNLIDSNILIDSNRF